MAFRWAACGVLLPLAAAWTDTRPPNVIVILADDLGWTDLGCCGSDFFRTPNIDRLARRGVRFSDAYSACTVCSPTRAALLTGLYPARLHLTDYIPGAKPPADATLRIPEWTKHLALDRPTLAERLKPLGYRTASVGKWHLGDDPKFWPTERGFDVNVGGAGAGAPPTYFDPFERKLPNGNIASMAMLPSKRKGQYLTDRLTDEAVDWIEKNKEHPFFLYLPHYAVHTPLEAEETRIEANRARLRPGLKHNNPVYSAMIESLDDSVGRIVGTVEKLGLTHRTAILFTSDNGGLVWRNIATDNSPLRNGKGSEYEGGVRVPLIVYWPGESKTGVCSEPVMSIDLAPTILELVGSRVSGLDGVSLAGQLRRPEQRLDRRNLFWHYPHYHTAGGRPYGAIRQGPHKLIEHFEDGSLELYDLSKDLSEKENLAALRPDLAERLKKELADWREQVGAQMPVK